MTREIECEACGARFTLGPAASPDAQVEHARCPKRQPRAKAPRYRPVQAAQSSESGAS